MDECSFARKLTSNSLYHLVLWLHIGTSAVTFASVITVLITHRNIQLFNSGTKLLLYTLFMFALLHSVVLGSLQAFHFTRDLVIDNDCDLYIQSATCCFFRIPFTFSIGGLVLSWMACAMERLIATVKPKYYSENSMAIGMYLVILDILASALIVVWVFCDENFEEKQINCGASTLETAWKFTRFFYGLMAVDVISVILFISLLFANRQMLTKSRFHLSFRFQIEENLKMIKLVSPIVVAHFIVFAAYFISTIVVQSRRDHFEDPMNYVMADMHCYVVPYFTVCLPLLFAYIVHQNDLRRRSRINSMVLQPTSGVAGAENYFAQMNSIWGGEGTAKKFPKTNPMESKRY